LQQNDDNSAGYSGLPTDVSTLQAEIIYLRQELDKLRRMIFGQKRERYVPVFNPEHLDIALDDQPTKVAPVQIQDIRYTRLKKTTKQKSHGRNPLPTDLPRKEIVIQPDTNFSNLKKIGDEIIEELEYEPAKLCVNRYIRPKYTLSKDEGVVIGNLPTRPIEKGIAGPGLLSHILVSKFVDHLPLYRQQFKRNGVVLSLSTITDWIKQSAELLEYVGRKNFIHRDNTNKFIKDLIISRAW